MKLEYGITIGLFGGILIGIIFLNWYNHEIYLKPCEPESIISLVCQRTYQAFQLFFIPIGIGSGTVIFLILSRKEFHETLQDNSTLQTKSDVK